MLNWKHNICTIPSVYIFGSFSVKYLYLDKDIPLSALSPLPQLIYVVQMRFCQHSFCQMMQLHQQHCLCFCNLHFLFRKYNASHHIANLRRDRDTHASFDHYHDNMCSCSCKTTLINTISRYKIYFSINSR